MTVVTRKFADISHRPDYYVFEFETGLRRSNDHDDLSITPRRIKVEPTEALNEDTDEIEAVLSVDLDPGPCRVWYRGTAHIIEVPESGPADLQDLLDEGTVEQGRPEIPSNSVALRGFRSKAVPVNPSDPNTLYQWEDEKGVDFGEPTAIPGLVSVVASLRAAKTITVGAGGDHATLNEALKEASYYSREYISKGLTLEVKQLSGFVMAEQVFVVQQDLSFVTLTSEDAEVTITRSALNQNNGNSTNNWRTGMFPAFTGMRGAKLPYIKTLYSMDTSGDGVGTVGVYVFENSQAVIGRGCGVKNAGWRGLYVDGAFAYARATVWDGAGFAGGPSGDNIGMGIRASNMALVTAREASAKDCYYGVYVSKALVDLVDADCSGSTSVGIASTDGADVSVSGATVDDAVGTGFRVDGARLFGFESSSVDDQFPSADNCGSFALVVLGGGEARLTGATLKSTGTTAVQVDASFAELNDCDAQTTASTRPAVRLYNGARVNLPNCTLEGTSVEVELNNASTASVPGCLRADTVSAIRSNVNGGEFSTIGTLFGVDGLRYYRDTDASFAVTATFPPEIVVNIALGGGRTATLYDSTSYPSKRHTFIHAGSGSTLSVVQPDGTTRLAVLAPGESVSVSPNSSGGWTVVSRALRLTSGRTVGTSATTLTQGSQLVRSSGTITADTALTMYAANDGAARDHTFTRADTGTGIWSVYQADGTTLITTVTANQWAQIAPRSDGTAWYVVAKGTLNTPPISGTASLNFGSTPIPAQSHEDLTISVAGAATGDAVALGVPTAAVTTGIIYSAWVSATNTVTVRAHNYTAGALDPASGTFKATVVR